MKKECINRYLWDGMQEPEAWTQNEGAYRAISHAVVPTDRGIAQISTNGGFET